MDQEISSMDDDDDDINKEASQTVPSRRIDSVVIYSTNTTQQITDYRTPIDDDHVCSSGSMSHEMSDQYACNAPVPMQCPLQEDSIYENANDELLENESQIEMAEVPDIQNELGEHCLHNHSTVLPLSSLNYGRLSANNGERQPSFDQVFQSICQHSATDMRNLAVLGDSFLKSAVSKSLYYRYPSDNTGELTSKRDKLVSNENLYQLAMEKELKNYLNFDRINFGRADANWLPSSYKIHGQHSEKCKKAFADMVEALIGDFLISTDYSTTIKFMKWLGLDVIPTDEYGQIMKTPSVLCPALPDIKNEGHMEIHNFFFDQAFDEIQNKINYTFKNKAYLIAAFTHQSSSNKTGTINCKRLKFIGNALVEFLVTRYIFITEKSITPGRVTVIRQDLLNKICKADILIANGLHTKIICAAQKLINPISPNTADRDLVTDEKNVKQQPDSKTPQAPADVLEALIGAIFLDSDNSLKTAWDVTDLLFQPCIDWKYSFKHPNPNPVRLIHEHGGTIIREFKDDNNNWFCDVKLWDGTDVKGYGKSKRFAQQSVCKKMQEITIAVPSKLSH